VNLKCELEYDGTDFCGWQSQPSERTVQGEVERALLTMLKRRVGVVAAGRTDSGVHGERQVISFAVPREDWTGDVVMKGLNALLPDDVIVRSCIIVPDSFNARYDAVSREYRYRILNSRSALKRRSHWCTVWRMDRDVLGSLASAIIGEHDFASFCVKKSHKESNICTVTKSHWTKTGKEYTFQIVANRFLHGMVRSLVGTMMRVSGGQLSIQQFHGLLETPKRSALILTAPPQGLTLVRVNY
jgi:tRNA pseudouridine38-40 synthase